MAAETLSIEYKSIQKIKSGDKGFKDLAGTCVCLANAQGGKIIIGFDDKTKEPPPNQRIEQELLNDTLERLRGLTYAVALSASEILTYKNGSEYFEIIVSPSKKIIATTSDGKIFMRIADKCVPVHGEDIQRIAAEKDTFQWELINRNVDLQLIPQENIAKFVADIRQSDRVKDSVKEKSDIEILEHYNFIEDKQLNNLGILWLGTASQRARLAYPITVQYIVYNANGEKIRKYTWDDYAQNPKELLYSIEKEAIELTYFYELPDGLFRKQVRHFPKEVIRELLINAFAHKSYLISTDIFIEVYPDRMTISSPGSLPIGITKYNILHERNRRNPHLVKVLHDLKLMEAEGSGYDMIYEKLTVDAKELPVIDSDFNKVTVSLNSKIVDIDALNLITYILDHFQLSGREEIFVGIVARHKKILATELVKILQLPEEERLRSWYTRLREQQIIKTQGEKKGTAFIINPKLLSDSKLNIKPTLKTIEPHRLKALIVEDLRIHPRSKSSEIQERIVDIRIEEIRRILKSMEKEGLISSEGYKYSKIYLLA
ncbi:MAG: putative DNA binding domain-containing protein [Tannerella sp.]|jgi:ATP-dependent DNA helicase RecG|nr:putative DNA binding domain-containing protein [Tannerella sp.]